MVANKVRKQLVRKAVKFYRWVMTPDGWLLAHKRCEEGHLVGGEVCAVVFPAGKDEVTMLTVPADTPVMVRKKIVEILVEDNLEVVPGGIVLPTGGHPYDPTLAAEDQSGVTAVEWRPVG